MLNDIDSVQNIKSRRKTAAYVAFVVLCLMLIWLFLSSFTVMDPPFVDVVKEEIEIEMPDVQKLTDSGAKSGGTDAAGEVSDQVTSQEAAPTVEAPPVMTNTKSPTTVNAGKPSNSDKGDASQVNPNPTPKVTATFGNGGTGGKGNGASNGIGDGDMSGLGKDGTGGTVGTMSGTRKILKKAPPFDYRGDQGRVVIMVYVDKGGKVITAGTYAPHIVSSKSNINDTRTIQKAITSAKKAVFSAIAKDQVEKYELVFDLVPQ